MICCPVLDFSSLLKTLIWHDTALKFILKCLFIICKLCFLAVFYLVLFGCYLGFFKQFSRFEQLLPDIFSRNIFLTGLNSYKVVCNVI